MTKEERRMLQELRARLEDSPFVMLGSNGTPGQAEPMTAKFDGDSFPQALYFFTRKDNRLPQQLATQGPEAVATHVSRGHELFATLRGKLTPCEDRTLVDRFWSNGVAAWFEQGKQDPQLQLLRFDVAHVELWMADVTVMGKFKLAFGGEVDRSDFQGSHVRTEIASAR